MLVTDVSGLPVSPIVKGPAVKERCIISQKIYIKAEA
jgi:hypothetical protein